MRTMSQYRVAAVVELRPRDWELNISGGGFELVSGVTNALLDGFTTSGGVATSIELVEP